MLQVTKNQSGGAVEVVLGESFEIQLPENPTTGYRWQLRSSGEPILEVQDDSFQPTTDRPGAGGMRRWRFRAGQEGATNLQIEYRRSWEKAAVETFQISVRVKPR
jgi:inhibitor of cysteine peptidase